MEKIYLVVDFDGTYNKVDFFKNALLFFVIHKPHWVYKIYKSKNWVTFKEDLILAYFELHEMNKVIQANTKVSDFIIKNKFQYKEICLISGTPQKVLDQLQNQLWLFDTVYGSTTKNNTGRNKLVLIESVLGKNFDYIGNSFSDIVLYKKSRKAYHVFLNALLTLKNQQHFVE